MDIDHAAALTRLTRFLETLTRQSIANLGEFYTPNVYLRTPLHEVRSAAEVAGLLMQLFERVDVPRFEITATLLQHNQAMLVWNLHFHARRWLDDEQIIGPLLVTMVFGDPGIATAVGIAVKAGGPCLTAADVDRVLPG